jgi:hypothetical protein
VYLEALSYLSKLTCNHQPFYHQFTNKTFESLKPRTIENFLQEDNPSNQPFSWIDCTAKQNKRSLKQIINKEREENKRKKGQESKYLIKHTWTTCEHCFY